MEDIIINKEYLKANPDHIFVYGDNCLRYGMGGAAALRDNPNTYGFITKIFPDEEDYSFYKVTEYVRVYKQEIYRLQQVIENNPSKTFLISKIGAGLANKYKIWEEVIEKNITKDLNYKNVKFLWL